MKFKEMTDLEQFKEETKGTGMNIAPIIKTHLDDMEILVENKVNEVITKLQDRDIELTSKINDIINKQNEIIDALPQITGKLTQLSMLDEDDLIEELDI